MERIYRQLRKLLGPLGFKENDKGIFYNGDAHVDPGADHDILDKLKKPADVIGYIYNQGWNRGREFTQESIKEALGL